MRIKLFCYAAILLTVTLVVLGCCRTADEVRSQEKPEPAARIQSPPPAYTPAQATPTPGEGIYPASPTYTGDRPSDITLYRDVQFEDIPIPVGYQMRLDKSYSFQSSRFRTGVYMYEGNVAWQDVIDYYTNEMPRYGWSFAGTDRGYDFRVLTFRKGPEQAILTIRRFNVGSGLELQIDNVEDNDLLLKGKIKGRL